MPATKLEQNEPIANNRVAKLACVDVHALHKCATMFLYKFFKRISSEQGFEFLSDNNEPANGDRLPGARNTCRCPIRKFDSDPIAEREHYRIFHVRDPRDILVSEYFSVGWIHPTANTKLDQRRTEVQQMTVDEYVLGQNQFSKWPLEDKFATLLEQDLNPESDKIVTYEEMVTNFSAWTAKVVKPFGFRFPKVAAVKIAWRYRNEFKTNSESMTHKRRIQPGDHRDKLEPATIAELNQRFEPILKRFGYLK